MGTMSLKLRGIEKIKKAVSEIFVHISTASSLLILINLLYPIINSIAPSFNSGALVQIEPGL